MLRIRRAHFSSTALHWQRYVPRHVEPSRVPLLLIHGFGCGRDDWGALPRIVGTQSKRPVITFDNRGIGDSAAPAGAWRGVGSSWEKSSWVL